MEQRPSNVSRLKGTYIAVPVISSRSKYSPSGPHGITGKIAGMNDRPTTFWKLFLKFIVALILLWLVSPDGCPLRAVHP